MSFTKIRGAGFSVGSKLLSTEMTQLDTDHSNAVDGLNGGVCTLAALLTFDGTGGVQVNKTFFNVKTVAAAYTVDSAQFDFAILCDMTSLGYAVSLPVASKGRVLIVKRYIGTSNTLSITPNGTNTIDGVNASLNLLQNGSGVVLLGVSSTAWIVAAKV